MDIFLLSYFALSSFNGFQPFLFPFLVSLPALDISITRLSGFSTHVNHLSWLRVRRPNTAFQLPYSGLSNLQPGVHWAMVSSKADREKDTLSSACGHRGPSVPSGLLGGEGWLLLAASRTLPCAPHPASPCNGSELGRWLLQRPGELMDKLTYINHSRKHPFFNRLHHLLLLEDHPRSSPLKKGPHKPTDAGHSGQGDHLKVCPPHFQALSVIC